jgi:hypothetical protein
MCERWRGNLAACEAEHNPRSGPARVRDARGVDRVELGVAGRQSGGRVAVPGAVEDARDCRHIANLRAKIDPRHIRTDHRIGTASRPPETIQRA